MSVFLSSFSRHLQIALLTVRPSPSPSQGIGLARQQFRHTVRVHGVITDGGTKPNIIPDFTRAEFYCRAPTLEELDEVRAEQMMLETPPPYRMQSALPHSVLDACSSTLDMSTLDMSWLHVLRGPYPTESAKVAELTRTELTLIAARFRCALQVVTKVIACAEGAGAATGRCS